MTRMEATEAANRLKNGGTPGPDSWNMAGIQPLTADRRARLAELVEASRGTVFPALQETRQASPHKTRTWDVYMVKCETQTETPNRGIGLIVTTPALNGTQ